MADELEAKLARSLKAADLAFARKRYNELLRERDVLERKIAKARADMDSLAVEVDGKA